MTLLANFLTGSANHYRRITGLTLLFMLMSWDHVSFQVLQKNRNNRIICHLSIHLSIYVIIIMCYIQKYVLLEIGYYNYENWQKQCKICKDNVLIESEATSREVILL